VPTSEVTDLTKWRGTSDGKNIFNLAFLDRKILVKHLMSGLPRGHPGSAASGSKAVRLAEADDETQAFK
jgi:hypothetical protein